MVGYSICRTLIRFIQCKRCSHILNSPVSLPCGGVICRSCLPEPHQRGDITFPDTEKRKLGIYCPLSCVTSEHAGQPNGNGVEHCLADCRPDITLRNVIDIFNKSVENHPFRHSTEFQKYISFEIGYLDASIKHSEPCSQDLKLRSGYLATLYALAVNGQLPITAELKFKVEDRTKEAWDQCDSQLIGDISRDLSKELNCQVCFALMTSPYTTTCGHTFCRSCVTQVLNVSNLCPVCRGIIHMISPKEPGNGVLDALIKLLYPSEADARLEDVEQDLASASHGNTLPLAIVSVSLPSIPMHLHIFEPHYCRMITRVMEIGDRKFGMVMSNQEGTLHGDDEQKNEFMEYGTLLSIDRFRPLPTGKSNIRAIGGYKFRVLDITENDGYKVAQVERVEDLKFWEEEEIEVKETTSSDDSTDSSNLDVLSTQQLFEIVLDYTERCRSDRQSWLNLVTFYGSPPTDPALLSYWVASTLPITFEQKYKLLPERSVRNRLKMCAAWLRDLEDGEDLLDNQEELKLRSSVFGPLLVIFCLWFVPPLLAAILSFANIPTAGKMTMSPSSSFSFSLLPFGFSFSHSTGSFSSSPPSTVTTNRGSQPRGFVVRQLGQFEYFPKTLLLGGITVICVARALRRVVEIVRHRRLRQMHMRAEQFTAESSNSRNGSESPS
ncbi:hypothetical protein FQN57_007557 [Myotisia sp. PD_48]|nr:hypothetical protein FQN57_007557 [Myotisia sp. PD_48]